MAMNNELTHKDCIFCKMITGEVNTTKLYEDADVFVFLDINPLALGHTIIIPKTHADDIFQIDTELFGTMMKGVKRVANVLENALKLDGVNLLINNRSYGGQEILHIHAHLIPRYKGVSMRYGEHIIYKDGEKEDIAQKIISELDK